MADPRLKTYAADAIRHLAHAGAVLAERQSVRGAERGNVPPWPRSDELDLHGTLGAVWLWARHQRLSGQPQFVANRNAAWACVESVWRRFIPEAIDAHASDEAPYDCAMVLMAHAADRGLPGEGRGQRVVEAAARVLAAYLSDLEDTSGREFRDPGFLAWNLIEYARAVDDRGLLAAGARFVERAFGMKTPPPFTAEPAATEGLFDFSSTTATRILAVVASEGNTPFVGAWLRERIAPIVAPGFLARRMDENTWNACVACALGKAYIVSTDPVFLHAYSDVLDELDRRDTDRDGALGRDRNFREPETLATFYYAMAHEVVVPASKEAALPRTAAAKGEIVGRG